MNCLLKKVKINNIYTRENFCFKCKMFIFKKTFVCPNLEKKDFNEKIFKEEKIIVIKKRN